MTTRAQIDDFLSERRWAVVGVSSSGKGFGATAYRELREKGFELVPVHPTAGTIEGDQACASLSDLPEGVKRLLVVVPPEQTEQVVREAREAGIEHVWMQRGAESDEAVRLAEEAGMNVIHDRCIMMFADPKGFHGFHRWLWGLLGKLPE